MNRVRIAGLTAAMTALTSLVLVAQPVPAHAQPHGGGHMESHGGSYGSSHGGFGRGHFGGARFGGSHWHGHGYWRGGYWGDGIYNGWSWGAAAPSAVLPYAYGATALPSPAYTNQYWYYCRNPAGYYPYVAQCSSAWQPVPAS